MTYILICLCFYTILLFTDILPMLRQRQWKPLKILLILLLFTAAINVLYGLNIRLPSLGSLIPAVLPAGPA